MFNCRNNLTFKPFFALLPLKLGRGGGPSDGIARNGGARGGARGGDAGGQGSFLAFCPFTLFTLFAFTLFTLFAFYFKV